MRITRVFLDVHMGLSFQGLGEIAKKTKTSLNHDSCVVFLNRKNNAFKLMVGGVYLTYFRSPTKIPLDALRLLPEKFGGTQMEFDQAVKKSLVKQLGIESL